MPQIDSSALREKIQEQIGIAEATLLKYPKRWQIGHEAEIQVNTLISKIESFTTVLGFLDELEESPYQC